MLLRIDIINMKDKQFGSFDFELRNVHVTVFFREV